ncbi:MAG: hypothetical protein LC808_15830 [Actinobacteria bacterium]|nr:hypothetical protein [Actinomycetota bacterium]
MVTRSDREQLVRHPESVGGYEQRSLLAPLDAVARRPRSGGAHPPLGPLGKLAIRAWCAGRQLASGLLSPPELLTSILGRLACRSDSWR